MAPYVLGYIDVLKATYVNEIDKAIRSLWRVAEWESKMTKFWLGLVCFLAICSVFGLILEGMYISFIFIFKPLKYDSIFCLMELSKIVINTI